MEGPSALLLRNCRVLDTVAGTLGSEPLAVLVVNDRIIAVDRPWRLKIAERLAQVAGAAGPAGAAAAAAAAEAAAALTAGTARQPAKCGPWTVQDIDCCGLTLMPVREAVRRELLKHLCCRLLYSRLGGCLPLLLMPYLVLWAAAAGRLHTHMLPSCIPRAGPRPC